jgi:hypothetical protein
MALPGAWTAGLAEPADGLTVYVGKVEVAY